MNMDMLSALTSMHIFHYPGFENMVMEVLEQFTMVRSIST